jgi:hypothetical protein
VVNRKENDGNRPNADPRLVGAQESTDGQLKELTHVVSNLSLEIVRLLVTHYARPAIRQFWEEHNILAVQTFEW